MTSTAGPVSAGRLLRALIEGGMVDGDAALAGGVTVVDCSHSNPVSRVEIAGRARLFVKQAGPSFEGVDTYTAEASAYRWLMSRPATAAAAPPVVRDLTGHRALVLEALEEVAPVHLLSGPAGERALAGLGRVLGTVHAGPPGDLVGRRPWVLDVPAGCLPVPLAGDELVAAVAERVAESGPLASAVQELGERWTPRAPMHGDVKFDNVLATPDGGRLWLIDWELAGLGEPAWDLAGVAEGLIRPRLVVGLNSYDHGVAAQVRVAIAAHRETAGPALTPTNRELELATVARLALSAIQLAAMRHTEPDCTQLAMKVITGAAALAANVGRSAPFAAGTEQAA